MLVKLVLYCILDKSRQKRDFQNKAEKPNEPCFEIKHM